MKVLIYGAPGAGKTTAGKLLHDVTKIELYEGDYLREVQLPKELGKSNDPFMFVGTKQAWRQFGELNSENVIKGLKAVRKTVRPFIDRELVTRQDVIFEASFLDPENLQKGHKFLVVTMDEDKHREQFFRERKFFHPKYNINELKEGFIASRLIQEYLTQEAKTLGVTIIQNNSSKQELLSQFDKIL